MRKCTNFSCIISSKRHEHMSHVTDTAVLLLVHASEEKLLIMQE